MQAGADTLQAGGHRFDPGWLHVKCLELRAFAASSESSRDRRTRG
jgi:hypothetical protein